MRYEIAAGTGGAGRYRGGNGLVRAIELVEGSAHATLLADRHTLRPPGAQGGEPGACGRHALTRSGTETPLQRKVSFPLEPGDVVTIQTPGGGGYGLKRSVGAGTGAAFQTEARRAEQVDDANRASPR